jgi:hypothetical protein
VFERRFQHLHHKRFGAAQQMQFTAMANRQGN